MINILIKINYQKKISFYYFYLYKKKILLILHKKVFYNKLILNVLKIYDELITEKNFLIIIIRMFLIYPKKY